MQEQVAQKKSKDHESYSEFDFLSEIDESNILYVVDSNVLEYDGLFS